MKLGDGCCQIHRQHVLGDERKTQNVKLHLAVILGIMDNPEQSPPGTYREGVLHFLSQDA